jgi:phosphate starvation-inducible protein PhoH and related proteins
MPKHRRKQIVKKEDTSRIDVSFFNANQESALNVYKNNLVTILAGPAGTGKTFLAVAFALQDVLARKRRKIILTRPIVEAGESLGFLPGDFAEKVNPYMIPLFDCYQSLCPGYTTRNKIINDAIEIAPLAYMRGRTFHDSVCIFDEAQNATMPQLKLFVTRLGQNSKMIITGDPQQSDLSLKSGFVRFVDKLVGLDNIGIVRFSDADIVRNPVIASILERLEDVER